MVMRHTLNVLQATLWALFLYIMVYVLYFIGIFFFPILSIFLIGMIVNGIATLVCVTAYLELRENDRRERE